MKVQDSSLLKSQQDETPAARPSSSSSSAALIDHVDQWRQQAQQADGRISHVADSSSAASGRFRQTLGGIQWSLGDILVVPPPPGPHNHNSSPPAIIMSPGSTAKATHQQQCQTYLAMNRVRKVCCVFDCMMKLTLCVLDNNDSFK